MARSIERIEQDIAVLEETIRAIAQELQAAYTTYLTSLGQAVQQQLMLASYHLCTQGFPENFLKLTLSQRQHLQQGIRKLGQSSAKDLLALLQTEQEQEDEQEDVEEVVEQSEEVGEIEANLINPSVEEIEEEVEDNTSKSLFLDKLLSIALSSKPVFTPNTSNPIELAKWQQYIEKSTQGTLKLVSRDANLLLQKIGILPTKLPEQILEAAVTASEAAEVVPGPPNLLNLVIEIENEQKPEDSGLTQIMAINLRLVEIEFADAKLSSERKQIRHISGKLNKIGLEYQKKQREKSIAEAEAAWRASWFED